MKSEYLKDKFALIEENTKIAKNVKDPQLASMLCGYLVVFISGIYEDCIEYLFIQRAGKNNDTEVQNLVKTLIDLHFRNPKYENIKKLVKDLSSKYLTTLRKNITDKNISAIDSIVNNKNNIAHGGVSNATINDIINYHKNAIKIFENLEKILS